MAVPFFLIVIIIYDLDLAALYPGPRRRARVAGIALSCGPPFSLHFLHLPPGTLFPCPPLPLRQQSSLFLPSLRLRVATRSPYLLRVRAPLVAGVGKEGRRDWRAGKRPRGAFCSRPLASTFLIRFLPFLHLFLLLIFS